MSGSRPSNSIFAARDWGALNGSSSLTAEVGRWTAQQVVAGRCTWLDLDLLRALGNGLSARLWAALEAWARWPQRSLDGRKMIAIGLGGPALQSLGVVRYERSCDARRALNRAGSALVAVGPAYEVARCERRGGGWALVVERLMGARARAEARTHGGRRDLIRHTFATTLVRGGTDLVLVAELLGHARLETTRRYTHHPTAEDRRRALDLLVVDQ